MQIQAQILFNLIIPYIHVSQKLKSNLIETAIRTVAKPVVQSLSLLMSKWLLATSPSTLFHHMAQTCSTIPDNVFFFYSSILLALSDCREAFVVTQVNVDSYPSAISPRQL